MNRCKAAHVAAVAAVLAHAAFALPARAGEQADRAVAAVRQLVAGGQLAPGAVLRLRVKQGNRVSMLGRNYELQKEWEERTGVPIDASVMPQLDSLEFIRSSTDVDLTIARNHEYADLAHAGLVEDLRPLYQRFGFRLPEEAATDHLLPALQSRTGDKVVAVPADLDVAVMFLRRDLLEDPLQRTRFKAATGRELAVPRTWQEYQQLVAFFARPQEGFYGAAEPREPLTGWMYWLPRYLSAAPTQYLFDDQMRPLINSRAGVEATESYIATVPFSPPQALEDGKDYSYMLPFFVRGQAFSTILTVATAKFAGRDDSAIRGKFIAVPMPGRQVGGQLVRRTQLIYGNNLVVPASAPNKALGFLFAMWLTDSDVSLRSVVANGIADPFRAGHLADERVRALYTPQVLDVLKAELPTVAPSGTGMPGDARYLAALNQNLWQAAAGKIDAREAMARTAREWEAITEQLGRAQQIAHWRALRPRYPRTVEGAR